MNVPSSPTHSGGENFPPLVFAVQTEVNPILKRAAILSTEPEQEWTTWRARWAGHDVVIVASGIGKVNAAMAVQSAIERHRPRVILVCGSAGGLSDDVLPGDLVIGDRAIQHDAGVNLGRRFVHTGVHVRGGGRRKMQRGFIPDAGLVDLARRAGADLKHDGNGRPAQVHLGPIVTGDQVVFSDERKQWMRETWRALAVEMESAAVAQVAQANGIPWLAVRGISDAADGEAGINLARLSEYVEDGESLAGWMRSQGRRLGYLVRHPEMPGKITRVVRGVRLAAERAAALTEAVLHEL